MRYVVRYSLVFFFIRKRQREREGERIVSNKFKLVDENLILDFIFEKKKILDKEEELP